MFSIDNILNGRPLSSKIHVSPTMQRKRRRDEDRDSENRDSNVSHWAQTGRVPCLPPPNTAQSLSAPESSSRVLPSGAADECSRDSVGTSTSAVTPKSAANCSSDDDMPSAKRKKTRTCFTTHQLDGLETAFLKQRYLSATERRQVASSLGLKDQQVKTWYQNRRMKEKKQGTPSAERHASGSPSTSHFVPMTKSCRPPNVCVTSMPPQDSPGPPHGLSTLASAAAPFVVHSAPKLVPVTPIASPLPTSVSRQPSPMSSSPPTNQRTSPPTAISPHLEPLTLVMLAMAFAPMTAASLLHPSERLLKIANPAPASIMGAMTATARNLYHQSPTTFMTAGRNYIDKYCYQ